MTDPLPHTLRELLGQYALPVDDLTAVAVHLAVPPFVTWSHLRTARRHIAGPGSLSLEFELVGTAFVAGHTSSGLVLEGGFRDRARRVLRELYVGRPVDAGLLRDPSRALSPLLECETDLVLAMVTEEDFGPQTSAVLKNVLLTCAREDRYGIRDWAVGAVQRLPDEVLATGSGQLLSRITSLVDPAPPSLATPDVLDLDLVRELASLLPQRLIAFHRDGEVTHIGPPSRKRAVAIRVPFLPGVGVRADWSAAGGRTSRNLDLATPVELPTGGAEVRITDVGGREFVLAGFSGAAAPENLALASDLDLLEAAWRDQEALDVEVTRSTRSGIVVKFMAAPMCTAFVPSRTSPGVGAWWRQERKQVRVVRLDRRRRAVLAEPIAPQLATPAVGDRLTGIGARTTATFGVFVNFDDTISGLLHNSEIPADRQVEGQQIDVVVLTVDEDRGRISLALDPPRAAHERPRNDSFRSAEDEAAYLEYAWADLRKRFAPGTRLRGTVVREMDYGLFVKTAEFEGLLHNSEIALNSNLTLGDVVDVEVTSIAVRRVNFSTFPPIGEDELSREWKTSIADYVAHEGPGRVEILATEVARQAAHAQIVVRRLMNLATAPVPLPELGAIILRSFPTQARLRPWFGFEGGRAFLAHACPGIEFVDSGDGLLVAPWRPAATASDADLPVRGDVEIVVDTVRAILRTADEPVLLSALGADVKLLLSSEVWARRWYGAPRFFDFLRLAYPEVRIQAKAGTGVHVVLPSHLQ